MQINENKLQWENEIASYNNNNNNDRRDHADDYDDDVDVDDDEEKWRELLIISFRVLSKH